MSKEIYDRELRMGRKGWVYTLLYASQNLQISNEFLSYPLHWREVRLVCSQQTFVRLLEISGAEEEGL